MGLLKKRAQFRYEKMLYPLLTFSLVLILIGLCVDGPAAVAQGLKRIVTSQDVLITDYMEIAGPGAALVNAGLVTLVSLFLLYVSADPFNGFTLVTVGLMAGFSLFGKNIANIWPVLLGTFLYARIKAEPFSKYVNVALLATALSPLVSFMALSGRQDRFWLGTLAGITIGFLIPPLSAYTFQAQNGMNLYNVGFACGLLAMMLVPVLKTFGMEPETAYFWATEYSLPVGIGVAVVCAGLICAGPPATTCGPLAPGRCSSTWASTACWPWGTSCSSAATSTARRWAASSLSWAFPPTASTRSISCR